MSNQRRRARALRPGLAWGAALLLTAGVAWAAGESQPAPAAAASAFFGFVPTRVELLQVIRGISTTGAALLIAAALVPLLFGARLLRLALALTLGCTAFVQLQPLALSTLGPFPGMVASCCATLAGGALGWYAYDIERTVLAVLIAAAFGFVAGIWLDIAWLAVALAPLLGLLGFVASRKAPGYLEVGETALLGAMLAGSGVMALASSLDAVALGWVGLGTVLATAAAGALIQLRLGRTLPGDG